MAIKKSAATDVSVIQTEDGHAIIGGRPATAEYYETLNRQQSGLPPAGAVKGRNQTAPAPVEGLPYIGVARQAVGAELLRLRSTEAAIERDLARGPIGASGAPSPYLVQRHAELRSELELIREQIARLSNLSDHELRQRAFELGAR
jgi:hypothetical protein